MENTNGNEIIFIMQLEFLVKGPIIVCTVLHPFINACTHSLKAVMVKVIIYHITSVQNVKVTYVKKQKRNKCTQKKINFSKFPPR